MEIRTKSRTNKNIKRLRMSCFERKDRHKIAVYADVKKRGNEFRTKHQIKQQPQNGDWRVVLDEKEGNMRIPAQYRDTVWKRRQAWPTRHFANPLCKAGNLGT